MMTLVILAAATTAGFFTSIPPGAWALIGTAIGTIGLKATEHWLARGDRDLETRREVHNELVALQGRLDKVEAELEKWRERYYQEREHSEILRTTLISMGESPPDRK